MTSSQNSVVPKGEGGLEGYNRKKKRFAIELINRQSEVLEHIQKSASQVN